MNVKILIAGKYNGENLRAVACQAGDVLETREWYAEKLITLGLAEAVAEPAPKKAPAKRKKPEPKVPASTTKNVFLE